MKDEMGIFRGQRWHALLSEKGLERLSRKPLKPRFWTTLNLTLRAARPYAKAVARAILDVQQHDKDAALSALDLAILSGTWLVVSYSAGDPKFDQAMELVVNAVSPE